MVNVTIYIPYIRIRHGIYELHLTMIGDYDEATRFFSDYLAWWSQFTTVVNGINQKSGTRSRIIKVLYNHLLTRLVNQKTSTPVVDFYGFPTFFLRFPTFSLELSGFLTFSLHRGVEGLVTRCLVTKPKLLYSMHVRKVRHGTGLSAGMFWKLIW